MNQPKHVGEEADLGPTPHTIRMKLADLHNSLTKFHTSSISALGLVSLHGESPLRLLGMRGAWRGGWHM